MKMLGPEEEQKVSIYSHLRRSLAQACACVPPRLHVGPRSGPRSVTRGSPRDASSWRNALLRHGGGACATYPPAKRAYDELHVDSRSRSHAIARSWIAAPSDPHVVNEAEEGGQRRRH